MRFFGSDRRDQIVRVFRASCRDGAVVRAKLTVRLARPAPIEMANALVDAATAQARTLIANAASAAAVASQERALELKVRASLAVHAEELSIELKTFGPAAAAGGMPLPAEVAQTRGVVLVVDDEEPVRRTIEALLADDFEVLLAASADEAEQVVLRRQPDVLLADYQLGERTGLDLIERMRAVSPGTLAMLITAHHDYPEVVAAMGNSRIFRVLLKPYDPDALVATIRTAVSLSNLRRATSRLAPV